MIKTQKQSCLKLKSCCISLHNLLTWTWNCSHSQSFSNLVHFNSFSYCYTCNCEPTCKKAHCEKCILESTITELTVLKGSFWHLLNSRVWARYFLLSSSSSKR